MQYRISQSSSSINDGSRGTVQHNGIADHLHRELTNILGQMRDHCQVTSPRSVV